MRSPYIISGWVAGDQFYGREALCRALGEPADRCVYLIGARRVGKTSLLRRLSADLVPHAVYCDLMQAAGLRDGQTILDEGRLVRLLRRELGRLASGSPALNATRSVWDRAADELCPWLEEAGWAWEEQGVSLTLLWDEAEMLLCLPPATLMHLRALLQTGGGLRLIICAAKGLAALNDRWRDGGSPFLFGFRAYALGPLDDAEAAELIRQRGRVAVSPEVVAAISAAAGGHPYLIQLLCDRVYQRGGLRRPSQADLLVDEGLADLFRIDVAQLSPGEQALLGAAARGGSQELPALAAVVGLTPEQAAGFAHGLLQTGYLRQAAGRWQAGSSFLEQWLRGRAEDGTPRISDRASLEISDRLRAPAAPAALAEPLSEREHEVLRLIAAGMQNAGMAARLIISENTIKAHIKSIYRKLGVSDRVGALNRAREFGLL